MSTILTFESTELDVVDSHVLVRITRSKACRRWMRNVLNGSITPQQSRRISIPKQILLHRMRSILVRDLEQSTAAGVRQCIHDQLRHVSRLLALPCPPLDGIGRTVLQAELPGV